MANSQICGIFAVGALLCATPASALVFDRSFFASDKGFALSSDSPSRSERSSTLSSVYDSMRNAGLYVSPKIRTRHLGMVEGTRNHRDYDSDVPSAAVAKLDEPTDIAEPKLQTATTETAPNVFEVQTNVSPNGWFSADMNIKSDVPMSIVVNSSVEGATHLYSVAISVEPPKADPQDARVAAAPTAAATAVTPVPIPMGGALLLAALAGLGASYRRKS